MYRHYLYEWRELSPVVYELLVILIIHAHSHTLGRTNAVHTNGLFFDPPTHRANRDTFALGVLAHLQTQHFDRLIRLQRCPLFRRPTPPPMRWRPYGPPH